MHCMNDVDQQNGLLGARRSVLLNIINTLYTEYHLTCLVKLQVFLLTAHGCTR